MFLIVFVYNRRLSIKLIDYIGVFEDIESTLILIKIKNVTV